MQQVQPFTSKLTLRTGLGSPLSQDLLNRDLDLLITSDPIDEHPELQRFPILRDPFVMIVPEQFAQDGIGYPSLAGRQCPLCPHYTPGSRLGTLTDLIARRLRIQSQCCLRAGQHPDITAVCAVRSGLGNYHRAVLGALSGITQGN